MNPDQPTLPLMYKKPVISQALVKNRPMKIRQSIFIVA
jgi:hypothetical protein